MGGRLRALDGLPSFPGALERWGGPPDPEQALQQLIRAAARVLAARDDAPIPLCHTVTAPAAIRMVLPQLPASLARASVAGAWQAVAGLVAAYGDPRQDSEADIPHVAELPNPSFLAARAAEHGDEHVIKLTEAALREYQSSGDPTLLVAADRFHGRVPRPET